MKWLLLTPVSLLVPAIVLLQVEIHNLSLEVAKARRENGNAALRQPDTKYGVLLCFLRSAKAYLQSPKASGCSSDTARAAWQAISTCSSVTSLGTTTGR